MLFGCADCVNRIVECFEYRMHPIVDTNRNALENGCLAGYGTWSCTLVESMMLITSKATIASKQFNIYPPLWQINPVTRVYLNQVYFTGKTRYISIEQSLSYPIDLAESDSITFTPPFPLPLFI